MEHTVTLRIQLFLRHLLTGSRMNWKLYLATGETMNKTGHEIQLAVYANELINWTERCPSHSAS
jgi:hypothetical protein